jgi:hypothetical protein
MPAAPLGHGSGSNGFFVIVPENPVASQAMWQSADLDFWSPVTGATRQSSGGNLTFTAPAPLPDKAFYSILSEIP